MLRSLIGTRSFPSSRLFCRSAPVTAGAAPPKQPSTSQTKAAAPSPTVNQKWREKVQKSLKVDPQTALIWHTNDVLVQLHCTLCVCIVLKYFTLVYLIVFLVYQIRARARVSVCARCAGHDHQAAVHERGHE